MKPGPINLPINRTSLHFPIACNTYGKVQSCVRICLRNLDMFEHVIRPYPPNLIVCVLYNIKHFIPKVKLFRAFRGRRTDPEVIPFSAVNSDPALHVQI